jgi:hypothetical protein
MAFSNTVSATNFNTDKANADHSFRGRSYLDVYEQLFARLRDAEFTLVEFGVLFGGSLRMWMSYFPRATVVGVDINPDAGQYAPEGSIFINASQTDERMIKERIASLPPLGIVIDDGSHYVPHMIETFRFLWPMVMSDGVYVMEDTRITYHGVDGGWPGMNLNTDISQVNQRADIDNLILLMIRTMDNLEGDMMSLEFHPMMIAFRKAASIDKPLST